ncbi:MAG: M20/M25/M40 family metallo-hydrolase, partial [Acidobacteria bacterium]|nr:M20/M25/M40 family metallo-hydrolase [Acidobacteriota bacterium]
MKKPLYFSRYLTAFWLIAAFATGTLTQAQATAPGRALSTVETELAEKITIGSIKDMTAALASPEMEGRGTGQPGGDRAAAWIADKFKSYGLKPLGDKGSYLQKVEFKETTATQDTSFSIGDQMLVYGVDYGFLPQNNGNKNVSGDMVFVSYGVQSKQAGINMVEGVDLSGKVVVMTQGPPPGFPEPEWDKQKANMLILRSLVSARAAAIVIIGDGENEHPPEELISYFSRRQLSLGDEQGYPPQVPPFIYVSGAGAEKLFARSGITLKQALEQGTSRAFKPVDLKQKAKIVTKYEAKKVTSSNVVGYLEGSDPKLKSEAVVFSAHYDAYGKENGKTYFGAADNALGTAEMLAVAEAFSKVSQKPKRSLVFIAVTGEEYGLYGSKYWAKNPTWDVKKVAADLNLDGIGTEVYGPVKTIVGYGGEHSTLGAMLEDVAKAYGVNVIPDPMPDEKVFYRSDHYSFVERGIPSLMLLGAPAGDKEVWIKRIKDWEKTDYHQPGDVIQPTWGWEGPETVAEVMAILGWRISENADMPSWLPSSRFSKFERGNTK